MEQPDLNLNPRIWLIFWIIIFIAVSSRVIACDQYLLNPRAGHPVEISDIHETDKNYPLWDEIKKTKLILMEPGICENSQNKGWYTGRLFVIGSDSEIILYGTIIDIDTGRFK